MKITGTNADERWRETVDAIYQAESRRVLATLIRLLGGFDLAEDALQEAFTAALAQWPGTGIPANPRAWLISAGRFKAIDALRRNARTNTSLEDLDEQPASESEDSKGWDDPGFEDDRLRLILTCCHPALPPAAQIALTLREVCGLATEEIARAYLIPPPTLAQRIVRAKAKIREEHIPYVIPSPVDLPDRLEAVLQVIYLVFNEGYSASSGGSLTRADLSGEAIRLGRLLIELVPDGEVRGLLALMLLHESRRAARSSPEGDLILIEDQDRSLWDQALVAEGASLVNRALTEGNPGRYTLQAAIAAAHTLASSSAATDWGKIVELYDALVQVDPSPVVELNRSVAIAMHSGPAIGLDLIDSLLGRGDLADYQPVYSVRAELFRRMGRSAEARVSYERALSLTQQEPERRFLERRLASLPN